MKEKEMKKIAMLIISVIKNKEKVIPAVQKAVLDLVKKFPLYEQNVLV
jgi:glycine/serine hydroxymethyltransferase